MRRSYGELAACRYCGQDIQWHGRATGWIDRGANRACVPFIRHGEIVRPRTKHKPQGLNNG